MASEWQQYCDQIQHKYDFNTMQMTHKNAVDECAIFGQDGQGWFWTPGFPDINQPS